MIATASKPDAAYEAHRDTMRKRMADASKAGRDIGGIPAIVDVSRRETCRDSLRLFCETYNPEAFYLGWSPDHIRAIERIEEATKLGALYAFAMPRGSGKTTLCRMGALWAVSYSWVRYVYLIGANESKAVDSLEALRTWMRFLPTYVEDFPEISYPVQALGGIANRASGQLCNEQPTMIQWQKDRVVLPSVPLPANWPEDWTQPRTGQAPTSGSIIGVSGLTGDGIRGSLHTLTTGEQIRPDLVLLDDPQTDESAASPAQNATRERLIAGAVLGMAGPGKTIAAVMPCTVIQPDDMVDRLLDRAKHPLWRGERTAMLKTMPKNLSVWEQYFEVHRRCAAQEPPDYTEANAFYEQRRKDLDEGAEASWPQRKLDTEVSAIQHAMNLYCRDESAFYAEYQNQPRVTSGNTGYLNAQQISQKVSSFSRGHVPMWVEKITAFIDCQKKLLWWIVVGWGKGFIGQVLDYGAWPDQGRSYYTLSDARRTLAKKFPRAGQGGALHAGITTLLDELNSRPWSDEDGVSHAVDMILIDAGWETSTVYEALKETTHRNVLPSFGRSVRASDNPMAAWKPQKQEKRGPSVSDVWWMRRRGEDKVRYVLFDANRAKATAHELLATPPGDPGCLSLFEGSDQQHRMFGEHLTAEKPVKTEGRGRTVIEFKMPPNRPDNHFHDCVAGAIVAGSMSGITAIGHDEPKKTAGSKRRRATGAWAA